MKIEYDSTKRMILYSSVAFLLFVGTANGQEIRFYAPELFSPKISAAVCGFSPDGKKIYFVREDTVRHSLVFMEATNEKGNWTNPRILSFSGKYNDNGGRLTSDGKRLYFSSDRPGGSTRENDHWNLWYTDLQDSGEWSTPVPLQTLNDKGDECCPLPLTHEVIFSASRHDSTAWWISRWNGVSGKESWVSNLNERKTWQWPSYFDAKQNILFLNSMKRTDTQGMDDIYISFYEQGEFHQPVNIGAPVNSSAYEDGAILSPDGKWLIFCRHATAQTPSQVMRVKWKPILRRLKSLSKI